MRTKEQRIYDLIQRRNRKKGWQRKESTILPADPTGMIEWKRKFPLGVTLEFRAIWEVEANLFIRGRRFRFYDNWLFTKLFNYLEGRWPDKQVMTEDEYEYDRLYYGNE